MLKRVLIDEAVEGLCEGACDFARPPGSGAIQQALGPLLGKALHPLTEGRMGKVEQCGDRMDVVARDDLTDGLCTAKDPGLLGLLEHGV